MTPRRISTLCHWLRDHTDDPIPGIRKVQEYAVSARFPAHQVNGIWHVYEDDRDAILRGLGLRPRDDRPQVGARRVGEQVAA